MSSNPKRAVSRLVDHLTKEPVWLNRRRKFAHRVRCVWTPVRFLTAETHSPVWKDLFIVGREAACGLLYRTVRDDFPMQSLCFPVSCNASVIRFLSDIIWLAVGFNARGVKCWLSRTMSIIHIIQTGRQEFWADLGYWLRLRLHSQYPPTLSHWILREKHNWPRTTWHEGEYLYETSHWAGREYCLQQHKVGG